MGSVTRARHPRRAGSCPTAPPTPPSPPGWPTCWPTTTRRCWRPTWTTRRPSPTAGSAAPGSQTGRALVHPVFFGSAITGAGVDALTAGITELLPAAAGDAGGPVSGSVFKVERGPAGEKVAYRAAVLGHGPGAGPAGLRRPARCARRQGHRDRRVRSAAGPCRRHRSRPGRSASCGGWPRSRSATPSAASPAPPAGAPVRPADPGDGGRPPPPGRPGRPPRRPGPAGRAGPADQPPPGRPAPGDLGVALRRGPEGGHPGHPGRRLRPGGRLPREHHHLHRAAGRQRGGGRAHRPGPQPVPGHRRAAGRAGPGRQRGGLPARGRARVDAVRVLRGRRGDRARDPGPGAVRLGGDRLRWSP